MTPSANFQKDYPLTTGVAPTRLMQYIGNSTASSKINFTTGYVKAKLGKMMRRTLMLTFMHYNKFYNSMKELTTPRTYISCGRPRMAK